MILPMIHIGSEFTVTYLKLEKETKSRTEYLAKLLREQFFRRQSAARISHVLVHVDQPVFLLEASKTNENTYFCTFEKKGAL